MNSRIAVTAFIVPLLLLAAALPLLAEDTILRHDNYLACMARPGETLRFTARSIPRAPYHEDLQLLVLDPASARVAEHTVPVGTEGTLEYPVQTAGLHVLAVSSGQPLAVVRRSDGPFALVAWEQTPVNICGSFAKHYFFVPKGLRTFQVGVSSSVTTEGARVGIWSPDGQAVVDTEGDFDKLERLKVDVPDGMDGQAWALTLTKPEDPKLILDDVQLWLGKGLPPYLCEQPEWLTPLVASAQAEQISLRVPVPNVPLRDGGTVTVTVNLEAAPRTKRVALRAVAQDVDYRTEGSFTLNGSEPYLVPVTGDGATAEVTVMLRPHDLRAGENVLVFKHDNKGSGAMGLTQVELLGGEVIHETEEW